MSQPPHIDADNPWLQAMADTLFRVPEGLDLRQLGQAPFVDAQGRIVGETDPRVRAENREEVQGGVEGFLRRNLVHPTLPPVPVATDGRWRVDTTPLKPETEAEARFFRDWRRQRG